MILEVCVDSIEGAIAAEAGGARRLELCASLLEGGLTPSAGTIDLARKSIRIGLHVMIRPRGGDFCYSAGELEVMKADIEAAKRLGADGVVFGILREDGSVDTRRAGELRDLARPLSATFHRAFDMARDPHQALEEVIGIGMERVLSSGQERTALEGLQLIKKLTAAARGRIIILPGGGITERNVRQIVQETGAREVHASARRGIESPMKHQNRRCTLGSEHGPAEYQRFVTDAETVRRLLRALE